MIELLSFLFLSLALGFRHSYDSDHMIAVSNVLHRMNSIKSGIKAGLSWALGHMITATIVTITLYSFRETILSKILPHFDKIAGIMLIALGFLSLKELFFFHSHAHSHGDIAHSHSHIHLKKREEKHFHRHLLGIGIVHGLASNGELLVLFTASLAVTSLGGLIIGLGIFSIGVVLGMILFTLLLSYPLLDAHSELVHKTVIFAAGSAGIVYGILMAAALV